MALSVREILSIEGMIFIMNLVKNHPNLEWQWSSFYTTEFIKANPSFPWSQKPRHLYADLVNQILN